MLASKPSVLIGCLLLSSFALPTGEHNTDHTRTKVKGSAKGATCPAAEELLIRSLRQARSVNVVAIITKAGDKASGFQRLKLEQRAMGAQLKTVLAPLSMQGLTFLDDGQKSLMYLPDEKLVFECQAFSEMSDEAVARMALAAKNYELSAQVAELVAGRPTFRVMASPKVSGLPARQFYFDQKTLYPLRVATEAANGQWQVSMDTQMVDFPREMPNTCFKFDPIGAAKKIRFEPAQQLNLVPNARDRLGFEPVLPRRLPLGFQVQRAELRSNDDGQLAVLWLTDGLATARVYEFRCPQMQEGIWSLGANTVLTEDGVTMMMVSDLDPSVRRSILSTFARRKPIQITPPAVAPTVNLGVKHPPVPSEEPRGPQPMFSFPERLPGSPAPADSLPPADANQGHTNNVIGDK